MICACDIETKGLDATKFILGCLITENKKKPEIYHNKQQLWNRIIQLGIQEAKRGKVLNIYAHNHTYDFYGYADLNNKHIRYYSHKPFIVSYYLNKQECQQHNIKINPERKSKEIIKFLDTLSIYRMSLQKMGEIIKHPKLETPNELLKTNTKITKKLLKEIEPYCIRDTEIVIKGIQHLRQKLKDEGVNIKRLYTINQIAINYLLNKLKQQPKEWKENFFWNADKGEIRQTYRGINKHNEGKPSIHGAYRGGRVEAFQTGNFEKVEHIDNNNLYGYASTQFKFPNLRTERIKWKINKETFIKEYLPKIGIARILIKNKTNQLGLLPVRTKTGNYYPKENKQLIGTYTHAEIQLAIKEGYELQKIEWTITWEETNNPFKTITPELHQKRHKSGNELDYFFYKNMANCSYGKLGQTKTGQEFIIDSVEKAQEYLNKNYEIVKGHEYNYMYKNTNKKDGTKKYYCPIIPTLINAQARIIMYKHLKKIPKKHLLYTDTDSIMYTGDYLCYYSISKELGDFKIEHHKQNMKIYGRKTYKIANDITIAGLHKKGIKPEDFDKGIVTSLRMNTIKTTQDIKQVGTFTTETRNLKEQQEQHKKTQVLLKEQQIFVDDDIREISHFIKDITL